MKTEVQNHKLAKITTLAANAAQPATELTATLLRANPDRDHIQGSANAQVILIQYGDYECPCSAGFYSTIKAIPQPRRDQFCFVFRHFPVGRSSPGARHAAEAAEAAASQGKFWQMHHLLFENQRMLADDDIARYSRALGLNTPRLMREVFNGTHASRVQEDIQFAKANGITHSPTFFVNGKRCDGVLAFHTLLAEAALPSAPRIRIPSAAFL